MQADLKQKQAFWETPRNLVVVIGAIAAATAATAATTATAATAAIGGLAGYRLGQGSPPVQVIFQPGSIVAPPAPAK